MTIHRMKTLYIVIIAALLIPLAIAPGPARTAYADPPFTPMGDKFGVNLPGLPEFVDAVKTSNRFSAASGQSAPTLDSLGWPQGDARLTIHDKRPVAAWLGASNIDDPEQRADDMSGTYKLSFTGQADIVSNPDEGAAGFTVQNKLYDAGTNTTTADLVVPAGKLLLSMDLTNTRRLASDTSNTGITNIKLIRPGYDTRPNQLFTDRFLDTLAPFGTIRAMDYSNMNAFNKPEDNLTYGQGAVTEWSDRKLPNYATQKDNENIRKVHGGAWEYLIQLANETGKDLWINIPVSATDDYIEHLAALFHNGPNGNDGLDAGIHLYVEYSNEIWNWRFPQSIYNQAAAEDEVAKGGSPLNNDGATSQYTWGQRRVAKRTVEAAQIFSSEFGSGSLNTTIRPVLSWKFVEPGQLAGMLQWVDNTYGAPSQYLYGIAIAPYIQTTGVSTTATPVQIVQTMWENAEFQLPLKQNLITLAGQYGVKPLTYEGGPDNKVGTTNIGNHILANRDPLMGNLVVRDIRDNWYDQGGDLFMYYTAYGYYSRNGSWGLTDLLGDLDTVKYNAALDIVNGTAPAPNPNVPPAQYTTTPDPTRPDLMYGLVIGSSTSGMNYKALDRNPSSNFSPGTEHQQIVGLDLGAGHATVLAKVRILTSDRPERASGYIQGSNDGITYTNLLTLPSTQPASQWNEYTVVNPTTSYRYYRFYGSQYFPSDFYEIEFYRTPVTALTGTVFGSASGAMNANALDGDTGTTFDNGAASGYVGIDLGAGNEQVLSKFRYYSDSARLDGSRGYVQGSNDGSNYVDLASISTTPVANEWNEIDVVNLVPYRYFRFKGSQYYRTQFKEIEFIPGNIIDFHGDVFGSSTPEMNRRALDGNTDTVFANGAANGYVGIDYGAGNGQVFTKFRYYPDGSSAQTYLKDRAKGAVQGSNDGVNYTTLVNIPAPPDYGQWYEEIITNSTAYRYVRFYGSANFPTQVKEIEFVTAP